MERDKTFGQDYDGRTIETEAVKAPTGRDYCRLFNVSRAQLRRDGFRNFNDYLTVVSSGKYDERLNIRAAMSETVPSGGGFSVPEEFAAWLLDASLEGDPAGGRPGHLGQGDHTEGGGLPLLVCGARRVTSTTEPPGGFGPPAFIGETNSDGEIQTRSNHEHGGFQHGSELRLDQHGGLPQGDVPRVSRGRRRGFPRPPSLQAAADNTRTTAMAFRMAHGSAAIGSANCDVLADWTTALTTGWAIADASHDSYFAVIEIDAAEMTNGYNWLTLYPNGGTSGIAHIIAVLEPRYGSNQAATALA